MVVTALVIGLSAQIASVAPTQSDKWEWDNKTPICALKQQPSVDGQTIKIERTPGNEETEFEITLPTGRKVQNGHFLDASVRTSSGRVFAADIAVWNDRDGRSVLYLDSPDPTLIDNLPGTTMLEISHPKVQVVSVPVRIQQAVVSALRDCENEAMRDWGIDPVAWRSLKSRPTPPKHVRDRFNELDYPPEALAANVEADAIIRLDIGTDGAVSDCRAVGPALYEGFQTASCRVLKSAKFQSAVNSSGNRESAPIIYDVRFRIGN